MSISDSLIVGRLRAAGCIFAEDEARLLTSTARTSAELDAMVDRRVAGLPLEQVLGWAEFCGLRITVAPGVFVPRRRTEFLVQQAAVLVQGDDPGRPSREGIARPGVVIVDLCCGAGAIGAALAAAVDRAEVHAADIDPAAVRCARQNLPGPRGHVYQGDLYQPLPIALRGRVAVLAANVPYVPTEEIEFLPPEARAHEPRAALDGGADGLDVLRRVAAGASGWLAPGGHLLIETSEHQAPLAEAAFAASGLTTRVASSADLDTTVVIGRFCVIGPAPTQCQPVGALRVRRPGCEPTRPGMLPAAGARRPGRSGRPAVRGTAARRQAGLARGAPGRAAGRPDLPGTAAVTVDAVGQVPPQAPQSALVAITVRGARESAGD
jgi:release factor glutamine methyltransferase